MLKSLKTGKGKVKMHHFAKPARPNKATLLKMQVKLFYDIGCHWMVIE